MSKVPNVHQAEQREILEGYQNSRNNWEGLLDYVIAKTNLLGREVEIFYEGTSRPSLKRRVRQFIWRILSRKKRVDGKLQGIVDAIQNA